MNFVDAIKSGFSRWSDFSGRSSRSEYWYWILFTVLLSCFLSFMGASGDTGSLVGAFIWLFFALIQLSVSVRRLHDLGKTGWLLLLALIPVIGAIILLIWFATKGTTGPNEYGSDPLENA